MIRWILGGCAFGCVFPILAVLIAAGSFDPDAIRLAHSDQPVLWIVDLAPIVLAGAGALAGLQHVRVDAALRATDEQVKERTAELVETNTQLEDLMESKDRFVAMVSHEVRNPLTLVLGLAQELRDGAGRFSRVEVTDLASMMADQSMEISNIIEDMLVAARAEDHTLAVVPESMDLCSQVDMVVRACVCAETIRESISLTMDETAAWADPGRVRQIIRNLISNAVRYGGEEVSVEVGKQGSNAIVTVRDNGPGVPVGERDSIFHAYRQASAGRQVAGSVGLGLHVSRTLARAMQGDLTYRYEDGCSVFELTLPGATDVGSPTQEPAAGVAAS